MSASGRREITVEEGTYLVINTPNGKITYYCGFAHQSISSFVYDVDFLGWYTKKPTKKTHRIEGTEGKKEFRMVNLGVKD